MKLRVTDLNRPELAYETSEHPLFQLAMSYW